MNWCLVPTPTDLIAPMWGPNLIDIKSCTGDSSVQIGCIRPHDQALGLRCPLLEAVVLTCQVLQSHLQGLLQQATGPAPGILIQ